MFNTVRQVVTRRAKSTASSLPPKLASMPNKYNEKSSAFNLKPDMPDGLFYQPAPSEMDPAITPKPFLPETDPRKHSELYYPEEDTQVKANTQYMPLMFKARHPQKYGMSKEQVAELQKMRDAGATRRQMKDKFKVSDFFISIATHGRGRK